jgi:hypothetical protein
MPFSFHWTGVAVLALLTWGSPLVAQQETISIRRTHSISELVALLPAEVKEGRFGPARSQLGQMLFEGQTRSTSTVDSILRSLEELAITAPEPAVRHRAISLLAVSPHHRGYPESLQRVFFETRDRRDRQMIISWMAVLSDDVAVARFVRRVALETVNDDTELVVSALSLLKRRGEAGRHALRDLHASGAVRDRQGRRFLEREAARGWGPPR